MAGPCGEYCVLLWFCISVRFPQLRRAAMWLVWVAACCCAAVRTRAFVRGGRRVRLLAAGAGGQSWSRVHATAYWFFAHAADRSPADLEAAGLGSCWVVAESEHGDLFVRFEKDGREYWWSRKIAGSPPSWQELPARDASAAAANGAAAGAADGARAPGPDAGAIAAPPRDCAQNLTTPDPIDLGRMIERAFESAGS